VADILGLNGKVTPRSIAYVMVLVSPSTVYAAPPSLTSRFQLYFSLTSASAWTTNYYNISLPLLYDFIVDFFEGTKEGSKARQRADNLLTWWNRCVNFYDLVASR
jgi:hypothetical protein